MNKGAMNISVCVFLVCICKFLLSINVRVQFLGHKYQDSFSANASRLFSKVYQFMLSSMVCESFSYLTSSLTPDIISLFHFSNSGDVVALICPSLMASDVEHFKKICLLTI